MTAKDAERLLEAGRFEEAERALDALISVEPKSPTLFTLRASARHLQYEKETRARRDRSLEDLLKAVEVGRDTYDEAFIQACSLLFHWLFKPEAEAAVADALKERPGDGAAARYQRARVLERFRRDRAAALAEVDRSIATQPHARAHLFRAELHRHLGSLDEAVRDFEASLRLEFRDAAHESGGETYYRFPEALGLARWCEQHDLAIIGIEGFLLEEGRLLPLLDHIADFSTRTIEDWDVYRGECNAAASSLLQTWGRRDGLLVNLTLIPHVVRN